MKILVTGDRNWDINPELHKERIRYVLKRVVADALNSAQEVTIIHGAARGVDTLAGQVASELGLNVEAYPADWEKYGKAAGPIRNRKMLDLKPDLVLAFHNDLTKSKGTAHCIKEAEKMGFPVIVFGEGCCLSFTSHPILL